MSYIDIFSALDKWEHLEEWELDKVKEVDALKILKDYLDNGGNPNARDHNTVVAETLLIYLVRSNLCNCTALLKLALKHGADINDKDYFGNTPLIVAAKHGRVDAMRVLLSYNPDVNAKNYSNETALMCAANVAVLTLLLDCQVNIEDKDNNGLTALMLAIIKGHTESMQLLIKHNADINAQDIKGRTPLLLAAAYKRSSEALILLEHNAEFYIVSNQWETPLMFAISSGDIDLVWALKLRGAKK